MKAEHRKELHTNALAQSMTRLVEGFKASPKSTSTVLWVLGMLVAGTVFAWYYFGGSGSNTGPLWVQLYNDTNLEQLKAIYEGHAGTIPGRTAQFQRARELLQIGLENLGGARRSEAIGNLAQARSVYTQLLRECTDEPLLRQEAMLGIAKAEEALIGVPQAQMPKSDTPVPPGDLDKAIAAYEGFLEELKLSRIDPESELYKSVRRYVDNLKSNREAVTKFYDRLNEEAAKKKQ